MGGWRGGGGVRTAPDPKEGQTVHQSVKRELSLSCARIGDPELVQPTLVPDVRATRRNSGFCPVGHRDLVKVVEQGSDPVTVAEFGDMPSGSK